MNFSEGYLFLIVDLGRELSEFFALKEAGEFENARLAAARAERVIDFLVVHVDVSSGGRWEMERWREIIRDALSGTPQFSISISSVESYFHPFALRLMSV